MEKKRVCMKMLYSEFLSLCKEADNLIRELLVKSPRLHGRRPNTLKAAAVHYLARKKGLHITLNNIYHVYGCYQSTTIEVEKIIRDLVEKEGDNQK